MKTWVYVLQFYEDGREDGNMFLLLPYHEGIIASTARKSPAFKVCNALGLQSFSGCVDSIHIQDYGLCLSFRVCGVPRCRVIAMRSKIQKIALEMITARPPVTGLP